MLARRRLRIGDTFGNWTLLSHAGRRPSGNHVWLCLCVCGTEREVQHSNLVSGASNGCGHREGAGGRSRTPEYRAWACMKQRCLNVNSRDYHRWGGRGIRVCERWLLAFENFLADMGPRPGPGWSLDRINNDGHYEPDNCRWATQAVQNANRRCSPDTRTGCAAL